MRLVKNVEHPKYKIQIFHYNGKYIVKIELGQFEQTFKIGDTDVMGLDDVENMLTEELLLNSLHRFVAMRNDWEEAFRNKNEKYHTNKKTIEE